MTTARRAGGLWASLMIAYAATCTSTLSAQEPSTPFRWGYEIGHATRMDPSWRQFWDRIWEPYIRPELRRLAEEAA